MADYPSDCIQFLAGSWWTVDNSSTLCVGRLLRAYIPHVERETLAIQVNGRTTPTAHNSVDIRVVPLDASRPPRPPAIPVASMPHHSGEVFMIQRAKLRPAIVMSVEAPTAALVSGAPLWQVAPTVHVVPAYGADQDGSRAGWNPTFLKRIRMGMYPQYMLDKLPLPGPDWSVLRFDQVQPIGRDHTSFLLTPHRLSDEAVDIVREWLTWTLTGKIIPEGPIDIFQGAARPT